MTSTRTADVVGTTPREATGEVTVEVPREATDEAAGHTAPPAPSVCRILGEVTVAPDGLSAEVAGEELTADNRRSLRAQLANELYRRYHMGRSGPEAEAARSSRDPAFEALLLAAMPHRHTTTVVPVLAAGDETGVPVSLDGVRVLLPTDRVETGGAGPGLPARVLLDAARPALSPGFFLCDGSRERRLRSTGTLRVYVHMAEPEPAPAVWGAVLRALEDEQIPYRAKVCSAPSRFPRQDGLVVYLGAEGWHAAGRVAEAVSGLPGVGRTVSAFVSALAPGVAAAWEPDDKRPGMGKVSFGEHRAAALAAGLTAHAEDPSGLSLALTVRKHLVDAGIDPADPARNLRSPYDVLPEYRPEPADAHGPAQVVTTAS